MTTLHTQHKQKTNAQPRRQFILDLQSWLEEKIAQDHDIILTRDCNDTYNPDQPGTIHHLPYTHGIALLHKTHDGKLSTLLASCGLVDPLAGHHSTCPFPASHIRGSERIVYTFTTSRIEPAVVASGCLPFYSLFNSDHKSYYLDFDPKLLFADPAYEIASPEYRTLQLNNPKLIQQ